MVHSIQIMFLLLDTMVAIIQSMYFHSLRCGDADASTIFGSLLSEIVIVVQLNCGKECLETLAKEDRTEG